MLAVRKLSGLGSLDGAEKAVAYALDGRGDDVVGFILSFICQSLVRVHADHILLALSASLDNTYGSRACCHEYAVSARGVLGQRQLFCSCRVHIGTNVGNQNLDVRIYELGALDVAHSRVVDNGCRILCAYEADHGVLIGELHIGRGHAGCQNAG